MFEKIDIHIHDLVSEVSFDVLKWTIIHGMRDNICHEIFFQLKKSTSCRYFQIIGRGFSVNRVYGYIFFYYEKSH